MTFWARKVPPSPLLPHRQKKAEKTDPRVTRAAAIAMYILCPVPLFILGDEIGLCMLLLLVAAATALLILGAKEEPREARKPASPLRKAVHGALTAAGLCAYFALSFLTEAWHITWLLFPLMGCIQGLVNAIWDLMGVK